TYGYADPEYAWTGHLRTDCDVWSYGVFLYVLITGKPPISLNLPKNEQHLLEWVKPFLRHGKFKLIVDPRIKGQFPLQSAKELATIAENCLLRNRNMRPKMNHVLNKLNELITDSLLETIPPFVPVVARERATDGWKVSHEQQSSMIVKVKRGESAPSQASTVVVDRELSPTVIGIFSSGGSGWAKNGLRGVSLFKLNIRGSKIGEGGFGRVYKGVVKSLDDPDVDVHVAVKYGDGLLQGRKEWLTEIHILGEIKHPNLVKLLGYCEEKGESGTKLFLVYEYMPNGSLRDHLSSSSKEPLPWTTRLKVAHDAACGLTYLHEDMKFQVILRDFKSSNILLDEEWNTKLSDFGVARKGPEGGLTHISTNFAGTREYAAPEYLAVGHLTSKSDVWSYGVFLYELITGRRPLDRKRPQEEQKLLEWVIPYMDTEKFRQIIDPRLEGKYSLKAAQKLAYVASLCLSKDPKSRPKMSDVLEKVSKLIRVTPQESTPAPNGKKEWLTEIDILGKVKHPNLVTLLGYCEEQGELGTKLFLVYEYMPNRSLRDYLSSTSKEPLPWTTRLKVAHDAACGLTYLHEDMNFQVILRDFKSSNILLDDQLNAKLSDFGVARKGPEEGLTHISTDYLAVGHLTSKSDVWSYGVFLYELITGRRPLDRKRPQEEQKLLEWVTPYTDTEKFVQIIDPKLEGKYSLKAVQKLSYIANLCLSKDPKLRPKMSEVLEKWVTEVNVLGVVEHPHLVKLIGYCAEDDERGIQRLLVYEYMPNRSVEDHLSSRSGTPLSWTMRLKVAQDAAHFKSSNILLDENWIGKLSDFGMARLGPQEGLTHVSTAVVGTMGYAAPEYIQTGHLTSKSDVWSYGVFLYELITGRSPLDKNRPKNEQKLLEWVKPYLDSKKFRLIIDSRLEGKYSLKSAQKLSIIANKCLSRNAKSRPKMSEVLEMVNQLIGGPSQATGPAPHRSSAPVVAMEPKTAFAGPSRGQKMAAVAVTDTRTRVEKGSHLDDHSA
ncbi:hypothetical protein M8C21_006953, partial [Ambrosia artemisiifolia]